jgi:hypothetical protein
MIPIPTYKYVEKRAGKRGYYITYEDVVIGGPFKTKRLAKLAMSVSLCAMSEDKRIRKARLLSKAAKLRK